MNNDEINKYIHEQIMGNDCFHIIEPCEYMDEASGNRYTMLTCKGCNAHVYASPDYCSDDSPRRLLWEVVNRVQGLSTHSVLAHAVKQYDGLPVDPLRLLAEEIARACVDAHQESK